MIFLKDVFSIEVIFGRMYNYLDNTHIFLSLPKYIMDLKKDRSLDSSSLFGWSKSFWSWSKLFGHWCKINFSIEKSFCISFKSNQIITIWDLLKDWAEKNLLNLRFPGPGIDYTELSLSYSFIFYANFILYVPKFHNHLKGQ